MVLCSLCKKMKGGSSPAENDKGLLNLKRKRIEKDCSLLYRLLERKGLKPTESYGEIVNNNKIKCYFGNDYACDFCKREYSKNQLTNKKYIMTPRIPEEALPKKSTSKRKTSRRRGRGTNERTELLVHAALMNIKEKGKTK